MRRLSFFLGTCSLLMAPAHAELILNEKVVNGSTTNKPVMTTAVTPQNDNFQRCLANLRSQAIASGISESTYDQYTQNLTPDYSVIDKLNYQPEFSTPIWDYLSGLVDNERVDAGKQKLEPRLAGVWCTC